MVRTAILKIDDFRNEFPDGLRVLTCDYSFSQQTNAKGETTGIAQGGIINLTISSVNSSTLMTWMFHNITMNGTITFSDGTGDKNSTIKIFKTIKFESAYLIYYNETFAEGSLDMTISLTISTKKITISDKTHENLWTKNNGE